MFMYDRRLEDADEETKIHSGSENQKRALPHDPVDQIDVKKSKLAANQEGGSPAPVSFLL